eukprot:gene7413-7996_t
MSSSLIFSPLIYSSLLPTRPDAALYRYIQKSNPDLFQEQIESYETSHTCWTSPRLGIGHCCGANLALEYFDHLSVLGIPIFAVPGCEGRYYRSALLVSRKHTNVNNLHDAIQHFKSLRLAINSFGSNSGWFLPLTTLAKYCEEHDLPGLSLDTILQTGSHNANVLAILSDSADLTAIDCISFAAMQRYHPELVKDVKVIGWTERALTPPFVTAKSQPSNVKAQLRDILINTMKSTDYNLMQARQEMFLVGVELNENDDYDKTYYDVNQTLLEKCRHYFPDLLNNLKPGRLLREHQLITTSSSHTVQVLSKARIDDVHWPKADFLFQKYLKQFLYVFLNEQISNYLTSRSIHTKDWNEEGLVDAIKSIVGREIWVPLPYGGSAKVILCSWKGVVHLLSLSEVTHEATSTPDSPKKYDIFRPITKVPLEWRLQIRQLATLLYSVHVNPAEKQNPDISSTVCFSGFMGCASKDVTEYFDTDILQASKSDASEPYSPSLMSELWAIDLALSQKLLEVGEELGIYVYISAPRHNDRYDWGNLVIGYHEKSIIAWRDTISHSSARKYIAPRSYEHIRIHRGVVVGGLNDVDGMKLQQTTFLEPKVSVNNQKVKETYDKLFERHEVQQVDSSERVVNPILSELNTLLHTQDHILNANAPPNKSFEGYDPAKTTFTFKRSLVNWRKEELLKQEVQSLAEDDLIPQVKNSVKSSFISDILEMKLVA